MVGNATLAAEADLGDGDEPVFVQVAGDVVAFVVVVEGAEGDLAGLKGEGGGVDALRGEGGGGWRGEGANGDAGVRADEPAIARLCGRQGEGAALLERADDGLLNILLLSITAVAVVGGSFIPPSKAFTVLAPPLQ